MSEAKPKATDYGDGTPIHLLMSRRLKQARGFRDRKKTLTFAFTSKELAEAFLEKARSLGMLADVDLLFESTAGKFFEWTEQGKASGELAIDPDPAILEHPLFAHESFIHN